MAIELNLRPDARRLRQFGWIACGVFVGLAAAARFEVLMFSGGLGAARTAVWAACLGVGVVSGLFSLAWPAGNAPLYVALTLVSYPIGLVVSYAVMATLFFAVVLPIGLALRLAGRDPMHRTFDRSAASYWVDAPPPKPSERYFRQY